MWGEKVISTNFEYHGSCIARELTVYVTVEALSTLVHFLGTLGPTRRQRARKSRGLMIRLTLVCASGFLVVRAVDHLSPAQLIFFGHEHQVELIDLIVC